MAQTPHLRRSFGEGGLCVRRNGSPQVLLPVGIGEVGASGTELVSNADIRVRGQGQDG